MIPCGLLFLSDLMIALVYKEACFPLHIDASVGTERGYFPLHTDAGISV